MWVLISFCNSIKKAQHFSSQDLSQLVALNLATSQIYFLRIPIKINPQGFTGITQNAKFMYTVTQGKNKATLLRIRKKGLDIDMLGETRQIKDPHSMIIFHDRLYVVSSGTNSIEMFDSTTLKYLGNYWQYPMTTPHSDQVHMFYFRI